LPSETKPIALGLYLTTSSKIKVSALSFGRFDYLDFCLAWLRNDVM
jgi:hypothetical protein